MAVLRLNTMPIAEVDLGSSSHGYTHRELSCSPSGTPKPHILQRFCLLSRALRDFGQRQHLALDSQTALMVHCISSHDGFDKTIVSILFEAGGGPQEKMRANEFNFVGQE